MLADELADGVWGLGLSRLNLLYTILYAVSSLFCSEAPACRLGSLARAVVADTASDVGSLRDASKVHPTHGERDAHRVLNKYWLSLRVHITDLLVELEDGQSVSIPHHKVQLICIK